MKHIEDELINRFHTIKSILNTNVDVYTYISVA